MAKITQSFIDKLKPCNKVVQVSLGFKLFLIITPKGLKSYRYIYRLPTSKAIRKKNIGNAEDMTLEEAFNIALSYNALLSQGVDPIEEANKTAENEKRNKMTLNDVFEDWQEIKGARLSPKHLRDRTNRFKKYLGSILNKTISDITLFEARAFIKPIFDRVPHMGEKIARDLREMGDHAVEMGILEANHLALLKKSFPRPKVKNNPCIEADELPQFLKKLHYSKVELLTRLLIEFQLLTMVRANEAVTAEWQDVDFDNAVWHIPAEKMKMKKPHSVPLSKQALNVLDELKRFTFHNKYIFSHRSKKDAHCSSNTANQAFYRALGYKGIMTPHGMRSLARTYLADNDVAFEVAEACLAHETGSQVSKAYNRTSYFAQRVIAMQLWGDYVEQCKRF